MASNDFTIDKQEYQSVFKVFDKDNTGEITIQQVNYYINKFEQAQHGLSGSGNATDTEKGKPNSDLAQGTGDKHHATGPTANANGAPSHYSKPGRMLQTGSLQNGYSNGQAYGKAQKPSSNVAGASGKYGSPHKRNGPDRFQYGGGGGGPSNSKNFQQSNSTVLQLKPTQIDNQHLIAGSSGQGGGKGDCNRRKHGEGGDPTGLSHNNKEGAGDGMQQPLGSQNNSSTNSEDAAAFNTTNHTQTATAGSSSQSQSQQQHPGGMVPTFPNGKQTLQFEEFIDVIKESCSDSESAENYLVFAFSMFDREKKGYITSEDLKVVFQLLGESVPDEELNTMIKIAGVKSNDKINFKEFVDFFYKVD